MLTKTRATVEDLYNAPDKAELVNGELVHLMSTGSKPNKAGGRVYSSLERHEDEHGNGVAYTDGAGFLVHLPNRESFSPDAAYYIGPNPGIKFYEGAPVFAVEARSENDYGPKAELKMAAKRADYFAAGTRVVWDVDTLGEDAVRKYTTDNPDIPTIFRRGEIADAEPAVPGWTMAVDEMFDEAG